MKVDVCDVCYHQDGRLVESKYRAGFRNGAKISVCEEHRNFTKGVKTSLELEEALLNLRMKRMKKGGR